jgi:predicted ATPase
MIYVSELSAVGQHGQAVHLKGLNEITVLFGRNATGKSQILRNLRDTDKSRRHYASPERGGEISYNPAFASEEASPATRGSRRTSNAAAQFREEAVARISAFLNTRGGLETERIPVPPSSLEVELNELLRDFKFVIKPQQNPPFELTRVFRGSLEVNEQISSVTQISSGEAALFSLGLDLVTIAAMWELTGVDQRLLLLDEADLHLHPDLQFQLARFLVNLVTRFRLQIIVATHSTTLLAAIGYVAPNKTSVIYINPTKTEQRERAFTSALAQLTTTLGGHALMGPLFAFPLFLVEGDDDYIAWSQAVRHGVLQLAVVPCGGTKIDSHADELKRLFGAILPAAALPSAFVAKDNDGGIASTVPAVDHVVTLRFACRELENLYLTDEVLAKLGLTWAQAGAKISAQASGFGSKAADLKAVVGSERSTIDLKGLIGELAVILDEKNVPWQRRIGTVIGEQKPTGQLAVFLGPAFLQYLWP